MDESLEALASAGSTALVQAMATEAWTSVRDRIAKLHDQAGAADSIQLDAEIAELLAAGQEDPLNVEAAWRAQLHHLLTRNPGAAAELRRIIEEFSPPAAESPQVGNAVSGGTQGTVVQASTIGSITVHASPTPGPARADGWPRAGQLRRLALGMRPAHRFADETELPPYVRRDCDEELGQLVRQAAGQDGLVVVTGDPLSGKTTTAWAVLRATAGGEARVFVAEAGADLRDLPDQLRGHGSEGTYVVWLDDLEGHLGEHGLTTSLLARLACERVLVLATMHDEAYDTHRFGGHPAARVLSMARTVEVPGAWSDAELTRLAAADDPRLVDAVRWCDGRRVAEFLVLGAELWAEWQRARRPSRQLLGHVLVRAAMDLARCGLTRGVTPRLLGAVSRGYEEYRKVHLTGKDFEAALAWAVRPRHGVAGLLVPGERTGTWRAYAPFIAAAARSRETGPVPDGVWHSALLVPGSHDRRERSDLVAAFRLTFVPRAASGDADAMVRLGKLAADEGDEAAAEDWCRKAADLGNVDAGADLAHRLFVRGAAEEAVPYAERARAGGSVLAESTLAAIEIMRALAAFGTEEAMANGDLDAAANPLAPPDPS